MVHNYKFTDLKNRLTKPSDTNINATNVTIYLNNASDLPSIIIKRLEEIINIAINEREQERKEEIALEDMNLESYLNINKANKELAIEVYIGYSATEDMIFKEEVITNKDKHYCIIKKYFFDKLNDLVSQQIKCIMNCV